MWVPRLPAAFVAEANSDSLTHWVTNARVTAPLAECIPGNGWAAPIPPGRNDILVLPSSPTTSYNSSEVSGHPGGASDLLFDNRGRVRLRHVLRNGDTLRTVATRWVGMESMASEQDTLRGDSLILCVIGVCRG